MQFAAGTLTNEMVSWLAGNREFYEFGLLHCLFHDADTRGRMFDLPLTPDDFRPDHLRVIMAALAHATRVARALGRALPATPSFSYYMPYLETACNKDGADGDVRKQALSALMRMMQPDADKWYYVKPYFEAWYSTVHGKRLARDMQMREIADLQTVLEEGRKRLSAAAGAVTEVADEMQELFDGESMEQLVRRPTGIAGLDSCLNGGWGEGECYLMFSGTGGGKSCLAGQCAWHECQTGGYPLIISTELRAHEYVNRIISASCSIPINIIQDCLNVKQLRMAVAGNPMFALHTPKMDEALRKIRSRLRVHKISSEEGLNARSAVEREVERYVTATGRQPTWVCLDWLGTLADVGSASGKADASARIAMWEASASGCVKFSEQSGIPMVVLAQAVNDSMRKKVLTIGDIGIAKGIGKNMVAVIGITNAMDEAGIRAALSGQSDMPRSMFLEDQFFCVCKSRKGEGTNVKVKRNFRYQRFDADTR